MRMTRFENDKKQYQDYLKELLNTNYDSVPTDNIHLARLLPFLRKNLLERDQQLTDLLTKYITQCTKRISTNNFFKKIIFWIFVALLMVLTVVVVVVFWKTDLNNIDISSVVALFSIAGTYLGSLISIFRIMSKYLFPIDELKDTIEMIKVLTNKDMRLQELFLEEESRKKH